MERDIGLLAHLEVQIKFTDDLGSMWAVDGYGVDWEVRSFKGPLCRRLGCDHGGNGDVFRNDLLYIAPTGYDSAYESSIVVRARALLETEAQSAKTLD